MTELPKKTLTEPYWTIPISDSKVTEKLFSNY